MNAVVFLSVRLNQSEKDLVEWIAAVKRRGAVSGLIRAWMREELATMDDVPAKLRAAVERDHTWERTSWKSLRVRERLEVKYGKSRGGLPRQKTLAGKSSRSRTKKSAKRKPVARKK